MRRNRSKANHKSDDLKRYLGIIHEEHMGALKTITERFDGIDSKLAEHDEKFDVIDKKFDVIDKRFDGIDRKLAEHGKVLNSHTNIIVKIAENIEIIKGDMNIVKSDLKHKIDYNEFSILERRVGVLESKVK